MSRCRVDRRPSGIQFDLTLEQLATAQQVVQGDMKVSGTISARAVEVSGGTVLTTKDISTIQSKVLEQVAKEITNQLRNNGNSVEMQRFSEQVTSAVAKTIGVTNQELTVLRRDLRESSRAGATSINEMRTALTNMQRTQAAAEREIVALRRELDQLRRSVTPSAALLWFHSFDPQRDFDTPGLLHRQFKLQ